MGKGMYHSVLLEQLLSLSREFDRQNSNLPSFVTSAYFNACGASDDLVPETYPNHSYSVLFQQSLGELDEFEDPGVVVERVVFCSNQLHYHRYLITT
jgi:hypothetical protein